MCLGLPGRVVAVDGLTALVDFWGVRRKVALDVIDQDVVEGDYVLVHVGFAIRRIAPEDLAETLAFFESVTDGDTQGRPPGGAPIRAPSAPERS
jgi:hydrogenase expression/formation protein HypC